jgi:hypothetical protein
MTLFEVGGTWFGGQREHQQALMRLLGDERTVLVG